MKYLSSSVSLSLVILLFSQTLFAQVQKQKISIYPFSQAASVQVDLSEVVSRYAYQGILDADRLEMVDLSHEEIRAAFPNGELGGGLITSRATPSPGLVLTGTIMTLKISEKEKTNNETGEISMSYEADMTFSVKVLDLQTRQIVASGQFSVGDDLFKSGSFGSLLKTAKTPEAAVENALKGVQAKVKKFILKNFKLEVHLVEILSKSGSEAQSILISGGSNAGFKKNQKLSVKLRTPKTLPNGNVLMRTQEIGVVKISKVEDENFSVCNVLKGGREMASALKDGKTLVCMTEK